MERLIQVLQERNIPLGRDDVQWAFESVKTKEDVNNWVDDYLNEPTLLTNDELQLYNRIKGRSNTENNNIVPVYDRELKTAIQALEESTASISAQAKTLETQLEALKALHGQCNSASNENGQFQEHKTRRAKERERLKFAAEDALAQLTMDTSAVHKSIKSVTSSLVASTSHRISSDDRTLASIEKLLLNTEQKPIDASRSVSIEQWCRALAAFQAAEVKARVQVTYENAVRDAIEAGDIDGATEGNLVADQTALEEELDSLYNEVASVAQMVVDAELRTPILQSIEGARDAQVAEQRAWMDYITNSFEFLTLRLSAMNAYASDLHAFREAVFNVSTASASVQEAPESKQPTTPFRLHARNLSFPMSSPFKLPPPSQPPLPESVHNLLRYLTIMPTDTSSAGVKAVLENTNTERLDALMAHYAMAEKSTVNSLASALDDGDLQAALSAAYVYSSFKNVRLSNEELEERLRGLESGIKQVGEGLAGVDGGVSLEEGRKREAFVKKWRR